MTDSDHIVQLFLSRSELAISATKQQYGSYCYTIAFNILGNQEDVSECVNDTLFKLWNSIPPTIPKSLKAYIGTVIRHTALDYYKKIKGKKNNSNMNFEVILYELSQCVTNNCILEDQVEAGIISDLISKYLMEVSKEKRAIFVSRYYYADSISDISKHLNITQGKVKITLYRMRSQLKEYLEQEGVYI